MQQQFQKVAPFSVNKNIQNQPQKTVQKSPNSYNNRDFSNSPQFNTQEKTELQNQLTPVTNRFLIQQNQKTQNLRYNNENQQIIYESPQKKPLQQQYQQKQQQQQQSIFISPTRGDQNQLEEQTLLGSSGYFKEQSLKNSAIQDKTQNLSNINNFQNNQKQLQQQQFQNEQQQQSLQPLTRRSSYSTNTYNYNQDQNLQNQINSQQNNLENTTKYSEVSMQNQNFGVNPLQPQRIFVVEQSPDKYNVVQRKQLSPYKLILEKGYQVESVYKNQDNSNDKDPNKNKKDNQKSSKSYMESTCFKLEMPDFKIDTMNEQSVHLNHDFDKLMQKFDSSEKHLRLLNTYQGENGKISKTSQFVPSENSKYKFKKNQQILTENINDDSISGLVDFKLDPNEGANKTQDFSPLLTDCNENPINLKYMSIGIVQQEQKLLCSHKYQFDPKNEDNKEYKDLAKYYQLSRQKSPTKNKNSQKKYNYKEEPLSSSSTRQETDYQQIQQSQRAKTEIDELFNEAIQRSSRIVQQYQNFSDNNNDHLISYTHDTEKLVDKLQQENLENQDQGTRQRSYTFDTNEQDNNNNQNNNSTQKKQQQPQYNNDYFQNPYDNSVQQSQRENNFKQFNQNNNYYNIENNNSDQESQQSFKKQKSQQETPFMDPSY